MTKTRGVTWTAGQGSERQGGREGGKGREEVRERGGRAGCHVIAMVV